MGAVKVVRKQKKKELFQNNSCLGSCSFDFILKAALYVTVDHSPNKGPIYEPFKAS